VSWGEFFLQSVLEKRATPERFELQYKFSDGEAVDAIVFSFDECISPFHQSDSLGHFLTAFTRIFLNAPNLVLLLVGL